MFMRLIILELDQHSRWIKLIGVLLIGLRAADWPYELAFHTIQRKIMEAQPQSGSQCWAIWGEGVIILNFIGDALANLFLSGMFVRRLFIHINMSKSLMSHHNEIIERIAQKSLICLALTFVVNLAMNLLKITMFLGDHSDAFTVYFEIVESTLLVEALRNDGLRATLQAPFCELCHKEISRNTITDRLPTDDAQFNSQIFVRSFNNISNNRNTRYSTYMVDTYDENLLHTVSSMEPVLFSEKNHLSLTNSIRHNGDPSVTCGIELNQQFILTQVKEQHIPLPANQSSPRRDSLKSLATEEAASPRLSSSIITSIPIADDSNTESPEGSPRLRNT
ncbi:MAG: hypothetical protein EXX96DRAFT_621468 [Benjaminiella poitrasii]|nr:MAG: hypothetical protein EXX96DRAFT_621468 [Benjaminiella poitrasii]